MPEACGGDSPSGWTGESDQIRTFWSSQNVATGAPSGLSATRKTLFGWGSGLPTRRTALTSQISTELSWIMAILVPPDEQFKATLGLLRFSGSRPSSFD